VVEPYAEPPDPRRPVVCSDGSGKEPRGQVAGPVPPAPGAPGEEDHEYTRRGTATLFVVVGPLAGTRHVAVTDRRATPDFAARAKRLCDVPHPDPAATRAVLDDPNTHPFGSLPATCPPDEGRRPELRYAPEHASWPSTAECGLSVLAGRCLGRRIGGREGLAAEVAAWQAGRDGARAEVNWTFRVADAREELDHLYPK
jgi:hypothetical protein